MAGNQRASPKLVRADTPATLKTHAILRVSRVRISRSAKLEQ
jgi:hypothetical protein